VTRGSEMFVKFSTLDRGLEVQSLKCEAAKSRLGPSRSGLRTA